jgi:hypothetical protein
LVISLSGTAIGTAGALSSRLGWLPFVTVYAALHGALLLLAAWFAADSWFAGRRAAAARAAGEAGADAAAGATV